MEIAVRLRTEYATLQARFPPLAAFEGLYPGYSRTEAASSDAMEKIMVGWIDRAACQSRQDILFIFENVTYAGQTICEFAKNGVIHEEILVDGSHCGCDDLGMEM